MWEALPNYASAWYRLTAGVIGAYVGSPDDLALIRMQTNATLPAAQCVCDIVQWSCVYATRDHYVKLRVTILGKINL